MFTLQDNYSNPSEPTESMTFSQYGIVDFQIQYWNGLGWQTVSGGSITGNNKVWKKVNFSQITTSKIRVNVTNALNNYSRVTELEAWGPGVGINYTYDAAGNVTNDGVHSYQYDSENRLVSVDSGTTGSYAYDHQNRRYKKTVGSSVTHYIWEGARVIAEHNGSTGAVLADYLYSSRRMIAKVASGGTQYFLSDRLSERLLLDTSGNVVGRQGNLPYGDDFAEGGTQEKHHFTSYERDSEAGTDYAVNRQYAQNTARFNRPDPLAASGKREAPQSWNRYVYSVNDPINLKDPRGLFTNGWGWPEEDPCDPLSPTVIVDGIESPGDLFCVEEQPPSEISHIAKPCSITINTRGPEHDKFDLRDSDHHRAGGAVTQLGPGEAPGDGDGSKFWFFFFEVAVTLPADDLDPNDWTPFQSFSRTGFVMYDNGRRLVRGRNDAEFPFDSPFKYVIDTTQPPFYYWVDAPDIEEVYHGARGTGAVVSGHIEFSFLFTLRSKSNPSRFCAGYLHLTLDISDKTPNWQ